MSKQVNELGLATQGVQYFDGTSVYSGVTGSTGQVLQANTSAAPTYSTATYPSTTTINQILYSSASNTVSGLSTANNGVLITGTTGIPSLLAAGTTGQVLVATTGSPPSWAAISGIGVTSITGKWQFYRCPNRRSDPFTSSGYRHDICRGICHAYISWCC